MLLPGRAEGDDVIGGGAGEDAAWIVVSVAIGGGASLLEDLRIRRRLAGHRIRVQPFAAVLVCAKHVARAPAPHHAAPSSPHCQLLRAARPEVPVTPGGTAVSAAPVDRRHRDRQVEPVHQADVIEVR